MSLPTSTWGQESDANRIKKTYVKGYMDISGGELSINNTAFNIFKSNKDVAFRMDTQRFWVTDDDGSTVDISLSYLVLLKNLIGSDGNAVSIPDKIKYITTYGNETRVGSIDQSSNLHVYGNVIVDNNLILGLDASLNGRVFVSGDVSLNSNLFVKSKTRLGGDLSLNGNFFLYGGDASLNGRLLTSGDVSLNSNLFVASKTRLGGDLSLNGNFAMYGGDASLNGRLLTSGDVSLNSNLYVGLKTRLNGDLSLNGNLFLYGGDASLNGRVFVSGDVSFNGNLFVGRDISLNGNLQIAKAKKVGLGKIPGSAYALDVFGNINIASGSLYVNDVLFGGGGSTSLTGNIQVGTDNGFVTVDKPPFLYDPSMTIFYDFDTSLNGTSLLNQATGLYDATLNGTPTTGMIDTTNERFGTACLYNNPINNQFVNIVNSTILTNSSFSVSLWIKKNGGVNVAGERIFDFADSTGGNNNNNTISLLINPTSGYLKPILTNVTGNLVSTATTVNVANGVWNHIVWNVTSTKSTIYINGNKTLEESLTGGSLPTTSRGYCFIGNSNNGNNSDFTGYLDNFRFYSGKTLSYAEVYQLYTSRYYNLDVSGGILANGASTIFEAVGSSVIDNIGTKGTLTLLHGDASGSSSILFPSFNASGSDYAYIQYRENLPYAGNTSTEAGILTIGIDNDSGISVRDRICLWASGGLGYVGVNNKFPTCALDISGTVQATSYNAVSDYRVKTDIKPLDNTYVVDGLNPVTYTNTRHGKQDVGFIAHEIQELYPFLVNGQKDGEQTQSLNYIGLIGILTKEIQDLKRRLTDYDAVLEKMKSAASAVENCVLLVEDKVLSVENKVVSVENCVLLEQARLAICETKVVANKTAINTVIQSLEERFQW